MRLQRPSRAPVTTTRTRVVVTGEKAIDRHTSVLPVMTPPGTACHADPVQYSTVKSVSPYCEKVIVVVGSPGDQKASCTEKTSTSPIVFAPAKSTSSQSGNPCGVASF